MKGEEIKDESLRHCWIREFRGRDNPKWPFCDPHYHTVMPGADFTVALREFLIARKTGGYRGAAVVAEHGGAGMAGTVESDHACTGKRGLPGFGWR